MGVLIYPMFALLQESSDRRLAVAAARYSRHPQGGLFRTYAGLDVGDRSDPACVRRACLAYGVGVTIFGGFAPTIVESLIPFTTSDGLPPAYYVLTAALAIRAVARCRRVAQTRIWGAAYPFAAHSIWLCWSYVMNTAALGQAQALLGLPHAPCVAYVFDQGSLSRAAFFVRCVCFVFDLEHSGYLAGGTAALEAWSVLSCLQSCGTPAKMQDTRVNF